MKQILQRNGVCQKLAGGRNRSDMTRRDICVFSAVMAVSQLVGRSAIAQQPAANAELDALIKAAKAEGELTLYSAANENVGKRIAAAFTSKYGINVVILRLNSTPLLQRFASEAEAKTMVADVIVSAGNSMGFSADAVSKGWLDTVEKSKLPILGGKTVPAKFVQKNFSIIQVSPWEVAYNTEKVKEADVPKDWPDLLKPQFKGQILIPDPNASDAYLDVWVAIQKKYGDEFYTRLRGQDLRRYGNGVQAVQALAAGEGQLCVPIVASQISALTEKKAPVASRGFDYTAGVEMAAMLVDTGKSKHPSAARLFVNYLLSPEGNAIFSAEPGSVSIYDDVKLPKEYIPTDAANVAYRDRCRQWLGFS